jgi:hypothetical protein
MEKNCARDNLLFQETMRWLVTDKGRAPSLDRTQNRLRAAVGSGRIKVKDDGEYWTITVPTTNASYRGAALISIDRWIGKDNGYSGISLLFAEAPVAVAKSIGKIAARKAASETTMPEFLTKPGSTRALLVCDFSN